jgi:hypothetical protein
VGSILPSKPDSLRNPSGVTRRDVSASAKDSIKRSAPSSTDDFKQRLTGTWYFFDRKLHGSRGRRICSSEWTEADVQIFHGHGFLPFEIVKAHPFHRFAPSFAALAESSLDNRIG